MSIKDVEKPLFSLSKDGFPIGGWPEPLPSEFTGGVNVITKESYRKIRECGFDFVCSIYALFPKDKEVIAAHLDAAEGTGVKLFISDAAVQSEPLSAENLKTNFNEYKDKEAFLGYLVKDEPGSKMFPELAERKEAVLKHLKTPELYFNLLPTYSTGFMLENGYWSNEAPIIECEKEAYKKYVKDFLAVVKPKFLSYDFYPCAADGSLYRDYFLQLSISSRESAAAGVPFLPMIQCCEFNKWSRNPTEAEVRWQANTSLAYGAKGLQYFTLWAPVDSEFEHFSGYIIEKNGETGERYEQIKKLNAFIKKMGKALLGYAFIGAYTSGEETSPVPENDLINDDAELSGDAFIGAFENENGSRAYYAVCNRLSGSSEIAFRLGGAKKLKVQTEKDNFYTESGVTLMLEAGEAALITVED